MPNVFFRGIDLTGIAHVGFDMDGTLYDECEWIAQAYRAIGRELGLSRRVVRWMIGRWLEKGSSYPHIFEEAFRLEGALDGGEVAIRVKTALALYRHLEPQLQLPARVVFMLEELRPMTDLFLVSDGQALLQRNKFTALGLGDYFRSERVIFTDELGAAKPAILAGEALGLLGEEAPRTLFIGDREIDAGFARSCGFLYRSVDEVMRRE
ncbi:MAG: HAD family hydrolase [Magnetococcales bacterium]|nr:HAD family hydrolase [Magnetococcales bacterium]